MGWLNAKEKGSDNTRLWAFNKIGADPILPELDPENDIADALMDLGFVSTSGMGLAPLSFLEIQAYAELNDAHLTTWAVRLIREMSQSFVNGNSAETPPYKELETLRAYGGLKNIIQFGKITNDNGGKPKT